MNVTAFSNKNFTVDVQQLILPERRHHVHPVASLGLYQSPMYLFYQLMTGLTLISVINNNYVLLVTCANKVQMKCIFTLNYYF